MRKLILGILLIGIHFSAKAQTRQVDSVTVTFEVTVPNSTPKDATIFWAGTLNHWDPGNEGSGFGAKDFSKSAKFKKGKWILRLKAPKGNNESYKYTRGSIYSVEERTDYTYRNPRRVVFDHSKTLRDTVESWHDIPPGTLKKSWPKVSLKKTGITTSYNGNVLPGMGTLIYDKAIGSRFFDFNQTNTHVKNIPDNFYSATYYYQKISPTSDNLQLIAAGKTSPEGPWHIYLDRNNDKIISKSEQIFTVLNKDEKQSWTGLVPYKKMVNGKTVIDSVNFTIEHATDLPPGYHSSANPDAPNLTYFLPYKYRKGNLNGHIFYIITPFQYTSRRYHQLAIDRNHNDTLEVGSGSNEVYAPNWSKMYRKQTYYLFPTFKLGSRFWEIANIDPAGNWIRLRPANKTNANAKITEGTIVPKWKAMTLNGQELSSKSLKNHYVFLDFWGSWCGPCVEEIPLLKKAYQKFKLANFKMIGFAYENQATLKRAQQRYHLPWPQVPDTSGAFSSEFLVHGYPTHYLINPDGKIVEMGNSLDGEKLIPTLEKYLKK